MKTFGCAISIIVFVILLITLSILASIATAFAKAACICGIVFLLTAGGIVVGLLD